ncbi:hypothetical protein F5Y16DRAFT_392389 [Xylariaceae sp. FL0255]|nr:hypothetical protein F5Y16DRAFT_392389 [Xylariaceae sp. FL0255]
MPKTPTLTNDEFIEHLKNGLQMFTTELYPLHPKQIGAIQRCTAIVDDETSAPNVPKKRAKQILLDLWTHSPETFLLCSLSMTPTQIGKLKTLNYMEAVLKWRDIVDFPEGLTKILHRHSDILPKQSPDNREASISIPLSQFATFVQDHFGRQTEVEISLPFSGSPLPYVRVGQDMKIELSWMVANAFIKQYRGKEYA